MTEQLEKYVSDYAFNKELNVLACVENGSRAWGYATEASDYDVKVMFSYTPERYKSFWNYEDVLTYKPDELHDMTFWETKKVLHLLLKGNAQVYELVNSPVAYLPNQFVSSPNEVEKWKQFQEFSLDYLQNKSMLNVAYHYYGLAYKTYKERVRDVGEPTLKKYFYVLRPLFHVETMALTKRLPSLRFSDCIDEADYYRLAPWSVLATVRQLLQMKRTGNMTKADKMRLDHVDEYCEKRLAYWNDKEVMHSAFHVHLDEKILLQDHENFDKMYKYLVYDEPL